MPAQDTSASTPARRALEAIDSLRQQLQAYRAIEQLVSRNHLAEDPALPHVQRDDFAALLGIVNASVGRSGQEAHDAASEAALPADDQAIVLRPAVAR